MDPTCAHYNAGVVGGPEPTSTEVAAASYGFDETELGLRTSIANFAAEIHLYDSMAAVNGGHTEVNHAPGDTYTDHVPTIALGLAQIQDTVIQDYEVLVQLPRSAERYDQGDLHSRHETSRTPFTPLPSSVLHAQGRLPSLVEPGLYILAPCLRPITMYAPGEQLFYQYNPEVIAPTISVHATENIVTPAPVSQFPWSAHTFAPRTPRLSTKVPPSTRRYRSIAPLPRTSSAGTPGRDDSAHISSPLVLSPRVELVSAANLQLGADAFMDTRGSKEIRHSKVDWSLLSADALSVACPTGVSSAQIDHTSHQSSARQRAENAILSCVACCEIFRDAKHAEEHKQSHKGYTPFLCLGGCMSSFPSETARAQHWSSTIGCERSHTAMLYLIAERLPVG